jgi:ribonuclease Y
MFIIEVKYMPTWIWFIILPVVGIVLGWIIRWLYARFQLSASEQKAERVKQDAIREAEAQKKEILLNAKDELIRERNQQERENRERRAEVQRYEARLNKKEELLEETYRFDVAGYLRKYDRYALSV